MELLVLRKPTTDGVTLGELYVDGRRECFTLEDAVRSGAKVPGETAIPYGRYQVTITRSQRFQRMLPLVHDVPGFAGVRIHPGNTVEDTSGCILVGMGRTGATLSLSRLAMDHLQPQLARAQAEGDRIWLTIEPEPEPGQRTIDA